MNSNYWDNVYQSKSETELSWHQELPAQSLTLISELNLYADDKIIDIGGGESHLVDYLIDAEFNNITILDISSVALDKLKNRLGEKANGINFVVSDIVKFEPKEKYRLWHDRATFHFLTNKEDIETYLKIASQAISTDGYLIVSTFSKTGPEKCSGLTVSQYSEDDLKQMFEKYFDNIRCFETEHLTPAGKTQNFIYCGFEKR
jgi:ubiquinone/menaquinone biosynthesis C-methylase UbiE